MPLRQRYNITRQGRGDQPLIFLHGYGCDQTMWRFIAPHFEATHDVVLYDHVGCGRSDLLAYDRIRYGTLQGFADDLIAICEVLDLKAAGVVGHSAGGMIALLAAGKRPDLFARLMLLGASPCYIDKPGYTGGFSQDGVDELLTFLELNQDAWAEAMAPKVMGNAGRPELAEELAHYFRANDPEISRHFARVIYTSDHCADLDSVTTPTLIMQCANDVVVPVEVGHYLHRHIRNSRLTVLDTEGHYPQFSHPDEVLNAMTSYLAAA